MAVITVKLMLLLLSLLFVINKIDGQHFNNIIIHIYKNDEPFEISDADQINNEPDTQEILIENQQLPKLLYGSFANLTKLRNIKLQYNNIKTIEAGAFINLPKLQIIKINFNQLTTIQNGIFDNLTITKLYLIGNDISVIDKQAFDNLPMLELIDLSRNHIDELYSGMFVQTTNLRKIDLSHNRLTDIPDNFLQEIYPLTGISLDFSHNRIRFLNQLVFNGATIIDELYLNNNNIDSIHHNIFNNVDTINYLNLEGNQLRTLSDTVLTKLTKTSEFNVFANPWSCGFVKKYMSFIKRNKKDNTMDLYLLEECFPV